jgi:cell wall-associated NlpC family hydrolase
MTAEKIEEQGRKLLNTARSLIGASYKYGAYLDEEVDKMPEAFDCSSFTKFCFRQIGIEIPRSSILQATLGKEISGKFGDEVKAGDLIFFEGERGHYRHDLFPGRKIYIGHVAIFSDSSMVIHACNNSVASGVVETSLIILPKVVMIKRLV